MCVWQTTKQTHTHTYTIAFTEKHKRTFSKESNVISILGIINSNLSMECAYVKPYCRRLLSLSYMNLFNCMLLCIRSTLRFAITDLTLLYPFRYKLYIHMYILLRIHDTQSCSYFEAIIDSHCNHFCMVWLLVGYLFDCNTNKLYRHIPARFCMKHDVRTGTRLFSLAYNRTV